MHPGPLATTLNAAILSFLLRPMPFSTRALASLTLSFGKASLHEPSQGHWPATLAGRGPPLVGQDPEEAGLLSS